MKAAITCQLEKPPTAELSFLQVRSYWGGRCPLSETNHSLKVAESKNWTIRKRAEPGQQARRPLLKEDSVPRSSFHPVKHALSLGYLSQSLFWPVLYMLLQLYYSFANARREKTILTSISICRQILQTLQTYNISHLSTVKITSTQAPRRSCCPPGGVCFHCPFASTQMSASPFGLCPFVSECVDLLGLSRK